MTATDDRCLVRRAVSVPILAAALLGAPRARAQVSDEAAAQGLFDAAKALVAAGRLLEACPKFLASLRADQKPGTAVNLADCYEKTGRVASAWARYLEAASLAHHAGQTEREQYARDHAAALEPKMARLTIAAGASVPGLEVLRDGAVEDNAILGTPVPVDPGPHEIGARAAGKKAWKKIVEIPAGAGRIVIEIPPLEDAAEGSPVALPPPPSPDVALPATPRATQNGSSRKRVGSAVLAVGGAGVVVGAIAGGLAIGKHGALASACPQGVCTNESGAIAGYHTLGTLSDVGFVVGGALAVTGVVLVVTAPKTSPAKQAWVSPIVGPGFAGVKGSF